MSPTRHTRPLPQQPQEPGRVVLSRQDRVRVDRMLAEYLKNVQAISVMLVDKDGVLLTRQGEAGPAEMVETISALVAGAYAVSEQMASAMGKDPFKTIYHEGAKDNVQLSMAGVRTVLAVFFDDRATLGMVRLYAKNLTKQLQHLFEEIAFRGPR